ncbi:MAG: diguanylate cyclase [Nitrospirae bacterium]|nr:diguanylate cyclase [Nitrospirota bacterium]
MKVISLRTKILVMMAGLIMLSGIGTMVFIKTALYQKLFIKLEERGITIARYIAENSVNPILTEKFYQLEMMAKDVKSTEEDVEYIFILDEHGNVLAHTFDKGFPVDLKMVNVIEAGKAFSVKTVRAGEEDVLDIAVPILTGDAGVIHLGISHASITKDINEIIRFLLLIVTAIMFAGITAAIVLSKTITKPVSELTKAVRVVGGGDLNYTVNIGANDEIGQLSESFNKMTRDLKERTDELERINSELSMLQAISMAAASTMKLHDLFAAVLYTLASFRIFKIEYKGVIFIIDGDRLKLAFQTGFPEQFVEAHKFMKVGECICGLAAETGKITVSPDCAADNRHTLKYPGETPHGHIIIPLEARHMILGVLCLYLPVGIEVSEREMALFYTIGSRIGAAIDNIMLYEETKELSLHDPLTKLANRRLMDYVLGTAFAKAQRGESQFSAMMIDIDYFKKYNDTYGHTFGDNVLIEVAKILSKEIRQIDLGVRYGGEEFLILLPDTGLPEACDVAERIRREVEAKTGITVSLGVSCYNYKMQEKEEIIMRADDALLQAKRKGRNRTEVNA